MGWTFLAIGKHMLSTDHMSTLCQGLRMKKCVRPGPALQASLHLHVRLVKNAKHLPVYLSPGDIVGIPYFMILCWLIFVLTKRFMGRSHCTKKNIIFLLS